MKNNKNNILIILLFAICYLLFAKEANASLPSSTNYKLQDYSFGSGGTTNSTSTSYGLNGIAGQVEFGQLTSSNYKANTGLTFLMKASVPAAPTLATPANNYDRVQITLNTSNNPTDATYAIQLSTSSNFSSSIWYVKSDNTIGTSLASTDYRTYTSFGGASGFFATGLSQNTTYYIRVKARQGNFTESEYGPSASITTGTASLTFTLSSNSLNFSNLNSINSYTDSSQSTVFTTSTNAYNGYIIYGKDSSALTSGSSTIANYSSPNSAPTSWSGTGFGYTTNDTNLTGGTANRFNNATYYAGFPISGSGDPVANTSGPIQSSQITNENYTVSYRVTAASTTQSGTYTNTIIYTIVPSY